MKKKSDKGSGVSFSPELTEVLRRVKGNEPELDEVVGRGEVEAEREGGDESKEEDS